MTSGSGMVASAKMINKSLIALVIFVLFLCFTWYIAQNLEETPVIERVCFKNYIFIKEGNYWIPENRYGPRTCISDDQVKAIKK